MNKSSDVYWVILQKNNTSGNYRYSWEDQFFPTYRSAPLIPVVGHLQFYNAEISGWIGVQRTKVLTFQTREVKGKEIYGIFLPKGEFRVSSLFNGIFFSISYYDYNVTTDLGQFKVLAEYIPL